MNTCLRIAALMFAAAGGLAAPTNAADATLGPEREAVPVAEAERWTLRPTRVSPQAAMPRPSRVIALSDLPDERRTVRIVYEDCQEAGSVSAAR